MLALRLRRPRPPAKVALLAHTDALAELPRYRTLRRRYRVLSGLLALGVVAAGVAAALLAARPAGAHRVPDDRSNRDIVLCLDVSNSMTALDVAVLRRFESLAGRLHGQRIALMIFDAGALLKFPLTDDSDFIRDQLRAGQSALRGIEAGGVGDSIDYVDGTLPPDNTMASSDIGDGLVSCAGAFDHPQRKRSRTIVLATDGEPGPGQIYGQRRAGAAVAREGIRTFVLTRVDAQHQDADYRDSDFADLRSIATAGHGGLYYAGDPSAVPQIVGKVLADQARALPSRPQEVDVDDPTAFAVIALVGVSLLVGAGWAVRR